MRLKPGLGLGILCGFLILGRCRPVDNWRWERAEAGLPRQAIILALAADPTDSNQLWVGYYAPGGLAASHNGGRTWMTGAKGLGDNPVFDLLPMPGDALWAATRDGLLQSSNSGASWQPAADGLPPAAVFALAADRSGRVYVGLDGAGLYVSDKPQAGAVNRSGWTSLTRDSPLASATVLSLAISPDGTQLYAGTAGQGLFASRDAGRTWTTAFPSDYVPNLALNPSRPAVAVASLRDRLVRTHDGGQSWDVLPIPWARDEVVSLLWLDDGTLWAGAGRGQVYCSQDGGNFWVKRHTGLPTWGGVLGLAKAGDRLLAGTWTGVYASPVLRPSQALERQCDDGGRSWTYLTPSLGSPFANTLLVTEGGLLAGTRFGLFHWQQASRLWEPVSVKDPQNKAFPPRSVTALAAAPSDGRVVYAGTAAGGLYRSDDAGASWARVPADQEIGVRALAIAPDTPDHVYILAVWERMYESNDGGQNWQARWAGLGVTTEAVSLAIDLADPLTLYLGADSGLYRSRHGGEDWRPVGRPLDDQTVLTLRAERSAAADGASVLYIGATRGAYRSRDGGDTVERWGQGLEDVSVTAFLFDPNDSQTVYAGTAYAGVYRSADGGETWQPIGPDDLADDVVEAMAWGPEGRLFVASAGSVWVGDRVER